MYHTAKTRPPYLLRQLITSSLTAGSLLLMPLIGTAHSYIGDTTITEAVVIGNNHDYSISEGVTVNSLLTGVDLFTAPAGVDFAGSVTTPNFINNGNLSHVRDDFSEDSATFRILADNFSFFNATTGQITIGKNYPITGTWNINGFVFSGSGGMLTNDGDIEGQGDYTIKLEGSNNRVTNSGTLRTPLTDLYMMAIREEGSKNTLTNSGTIEANNAPIASFGTNFTLLNNEDGIINAASFNDGVYSVGENATIINDGSISAGTQYGVYSGGDNANITNNGNIVSTFNGVLATGPNTTINNTGKISSDDAAWISGASSSIINSGEITSTSNFGVSISGIDSTLRNTNTGVISASADGQYGVYSEGENATIINDGSISAGTRYGVYSGGVNTNITSSGSVSANQLGVRSYGDNAIITNSGSVSANQFGVYSTGDKATITNEGSLTIPLYYGLVSLGDNATITNSGSLLKPIAYGLYSGGVNTTITNSGSVSANVYAVYNLTNRAKITNDGSIYAGQYGLYNGEGNNVEVTNTGTITSGLYTYRGYTVFDNILVNSGTIGSILDNTLVSSGSYAYRVTDGSENLALSNENTGVIEAANNYGVWFSTSKNISVTNAGKVKAGSEYAVFLAYDEDVSITNSGTIEAGDDTVTILGGKNISLTNTGHITSDGTVAISARDVEGLTLNLLGGTITRDINLSSGNTAPESYTPTVKLNNLTVDGALNFQSYDSSGTTWTQVSKLQTEKSSEQVALEDKIQALEEALQVYAPSKKDGAVHKPLTADLSKEETLELASKVVREEGSQEQREKEMQLRTELIQLQSELDTLIEAEVDKAAAVPYDTSQSRPSSGNLAVGQVAFGSDSTVSIRDSNISLYTGYNDSLPFSDDSSGNSFNVARGQKVETVTLSPAASTINIGGAVGNINLATLQAPITQEYTANLSPSGMLNSVNFGRTKDDVYTKPTPTILKLKAIDNPTTADVKANVSQPMQMPPTQIQVSSDNLANTITVDMGLGNPYCMSLVGSAGSVTIQDAHGQALTHIPGQMAAFGTDNCHTFVAANSGLLDARYDKLSDKIINLDHKLQDGNTDWLFEVRYQDMRQDTDENQPHANSTILALSKLWHTTRGDWIFQASHDSTHIGQHLNNNSASIVLGHSQNWGKSSQLHMQLGGDRREMSINLVGDQETVIESSDYSVVYGEIGMGRVLHKIAGHDINMRMRLAAERIGSIGKGWDSDTISLMIPELSVSGRVLPSVLTDASHRLYGFLQKPMGDTTQKYTITGFSEDTFHYDTDVSGGIGYDLHAGVGANTMLHAKASYLNTGYLSLGLGISQNL